MSNEKKVEHTNWKTQIDLEAFDNLRCKILEFVLEEKTAPVDTMMACASVIGLMLGGSVCPCCRPELLEEIGTVIEAEIEENIEEGTAFEGRRQ